MCTSVAGISALAGHLNAESGANGLEYPVYISSGGKSDDRVKPFLIYNRKRCLIAPAGNGILLKSVI